MPEVIRVMQVMRSFNIESDGGGEERFVTELVQALDQKKIEITICGLWELCTVQEQKRMRGLEAMGISTFTTARWDERHPYLSMWRAMVGLKTALRSHPADIVHVHSVFGVMAVLLLGVSRHHPKLIRTLHNHPRLEWSRRSLRHLFILHFLDPFLFDKEIGVSRALVDLLDRRWLVHLLEKKAHFVSNAVNLERFEDISIDNAEKRRSLGIPDGALVIGSIGRLTALKGWTYLLDAASRVIRQEPQTFFMIIGDGPQADQLKHQAAREGISSHIIFTGGRPDVEELLACMDLFVSASLREALPTVILESMAAGVPVVATNISGTNDLIIDKRNGWLVPPADAHALAQAIQVALGDSKMCRVFSERNRQGVQLFSMKATAAAYEKIYSEAVQFDRKQKLISSM
jgi:glycosyltransferase involved in cell wall biosynthesis